MSFTIRRAGIECLDALAASPRTTTTDTGEVRVPRMVGFFAIGRMPNAKTTRSQLLAGWRGGLVLRSASAIASMPTPECAGVGERGFVCRSAASGRGL